MLKTLEKPPLEHSPTLIDQYGHELNELSARINDEEDFGDLGELLESVGSLKKFLDQLICVVLVRCEDQGNADFSDAQSRGAAALALGVTSHRVSTMVNVARDVTQPTRFQKQFLEAEPNFPATTEAFQRGAISFDACKTIRDILGDVERSPEWYALEAQFAAMAVHMRPDQLRAHAKMMIMALGMGTNKEDREARRSVGIGEQKADLMSTLFGEVDDQLATLLKRLFLDYGKPGALLEEGADDTRTKVQRQHDALKAALMVVLEQGGPMAPKRGAASVVATMTVDQLAALNGVAMTDVGTVVSVEELLEMGAAKHWYLAVLDGTTGNLLHLSRTRRGADMAMYLGLLASQGGDQTPGSNVPAAQCEIHHAIAYAMGGETSEDNLIFISPWTHRKVDDKEENENKYWTVVEDGKIYFREPRYVNRDRPLATNCAPWLYLNPGQQIRYAAKGQSRSWFAHITDDIDPLSRSADRA